MKKHVPDWICNDTCIDTVNHPTGEAWVETHEHPETGEKIYLAVDTSGCNGGIIGVFDSYEDACNTVGEQEGFVDGWERL